MAIQVKDGRVRVKTFTVKTVEGVDAPTLDVSLEGRSTFSTFDSSTGTDRIEKHRSGGRIWNRASVSDGVGPLRRLSLAFGAFANATKKRGISPAQEAAYNAAENQYEANRAHQKEVTRGRGLFGLKSRPYIEQTGEKVVDAADVNPSTYAVAESAYEANASDVQL